MVDKVIPIALRKWSKETQEVFSETMKKMLAWWFPWKDFLKQYQKKITSLLDYFLSAIGIKGKILASDGVCGYYAARIPCLPAGKVSGLQMPTITPVPLT